MMPLRHTLQYNVRKLIRRFPVLRRLSISLLYLTLIWVYIIYWGERGTYQSHIAACDWKNWEKWPSEARPHHLVFVADPQLVDPHTYPGRPWPLSSLTETYTDLYMKRNFRLINGNLDPDSIVFLGDLFDGGREWDVNPKHPRTKFKSKLKSFFKRQTEQKAENAATKKDGDLEKRQEPQYDRDLSLFAPGENGRWSKWGAEQWQSEYHRFSRIFFDRDQVYPDEHRELVPHTDETSHMIGGIENGAKNKPWLSYAISGSKTRRIITNLPGNHDLGFGDGVQLPVRRRFLLHFGEPNSVNIIGNHTFVSLDTPSISAASQFLTDGTETNEARMKELEYIWKEPLDFLANLKTNTEKAILEGMERFFPSNKEKHLFRHEATLAPEAEKLPAQKQEAGYQLPVVLLTHVPLYREHNLDCGRQRERGTSIPLVRGYQYQNVVTRSLSNTIAKQVAKAGDLVHVFSGDDHDYCDVMHNYNYGAALPLQVREITVKSFSWAMGVRRPGFQLVSLWNPIDEHGVTIGTPLPTIQSHMCLLPDQLSIFIRYALLFGFTLATLTVRAVWVGLKKDPNEDSQLDLIATAKLALPQFSIDSNGSANGFSPIKANSSITKGRKRGSSTSLSKQNNEHLSVQRSTNARTRSVSPTPGNGFSNTSNLFSTGGPLIDRAGYYPDLRWRDPSDDSDEESNIGDPIDSQQKWKPRKKQKGRVFMVFEEFITSLLVVALPAGLWYFWWFSSG